MNAQLSLTDELIRAAIARRATRGDAGDLRERVLAATAAAPQRPGWRVGLKQGLVLAPRRFTLAVMVVLLLAMALIVALVGRQVDRPIPGALGRLAYLAGGDLYVADADGGSPRLVWDVPASEDGAPHQLVWLDPESVLMVSYSLTEGGSVRVVDINTGENRLLDTGEFAALSPDRRQVATRSFQEASPTARLRIVDVASGALLAELENEPGMNVLDWSQDGRWLVGDTPDSIYRISVATGELTELVTGLCCGLSGHSPKWSPDGSRVVYVDYHLPPPRGSGLRAADCYFRCGTLWAVDPDGGEPTRITPELGSEILPVLSPDGRWIAYIEENIDGIRQGDDLVVIAADGTGRRVPTPPFAISAPLPDDPPSGHAFAWDPDSGGLSYLNPGASLWHITLDGRASRIEASPMSEFAWQVVP